MKSLVNTGPDEPLGTGVDVSGEFSVDVANDDCFVVRYVVRNVL